MEKSIYKIPKMDCPSEENLIRMKLDGIPSIKNLDFDIPNRTLTVFHDGQGDQIEQSIIDLDLGGKKVKTIETKEVEFSENANLTIINVATTYKTLEDLEKMIEWGYMDGFTAVMKNLDELFATIKKQKK